MHTAACARACMRPWTRCAHESAEAGSWLLILLCLFRLQVLDTAAKYNLRLIIALVNNWDQDSNADNKCAAHVACTGSCLMCSEQSQPLYAWPMWGMLPSPAGAQRMLSRSGRAQLSYS